VPGDATTGPGGRWRRSPGHALLGSLLGAWRWTPAALIFAEDLGVITPGGGRCAIAFALQA